MSADVYRIDWYPGSDQLMGVCHCGAHRIGEDPIELWQWLLGHPAAHRLQPAPRPSGVLADVGA